MWCVQRGTSAFCPQTAGELHFTSMTLSGVEAGLENECMNKFGHLLAFMTLKWHHIYHCFFFFFKTISICKLRRTISKTCFTEKCFAIFTLGCDFSCSVGEDVLERNKAFGWSFFTCSEAKLSSSNPLSSLLKLSDSLLMEWRDTHCPQASGSQCLDVLLFNN